MPIPSVVLDTNILISAHISPRGLEYQVRELALRGQLRLFVSEPILFEYEVVLFRRKFRFLPGIIAESLRQIRQHSTLITPSVTLAVSPDESDNRFLECAEAAQVDFLVTGNLRHFPSVWKSTRIVNARELVESVFHL
jgi:putative PIN family toxin of toxin-antitoxin system